MTCQATSKQPITQQGTGNSGQKADYAPGKSKRNASRISCRDLVVRGGTLLLAGAAMLPGAAASRQPLWDSAGAGLPGRSLLPQNPSGMANLSDINAATATAAAVWTGTWAASPQSSAETFNQQTLRQIVHTSIGGTAARLHVSNAFGTQPVQLDHVYMAQRASGASVVESSQRRVTFGGQKAVTVAPGVSVASDTIALTVGALSDVAVSFYLPQSVSAATCHGVGSQTNYIATGRVSGHTDITVASTFSSYCFLSNVDVLNTASPGAVVALGASITDGVGSASDTNQRWTNDLAVRLATAGSQVGVLNQGISGNRLLADGTGDSALRRFKRDALSQPNVRWIIFSDDPINDLGNTPSPTADQLIAGLTSLVDQTHQAGLKIICSTLTPFQGAGYWTAQAETEREAVNAFIRGATSGCDGIIDQDTATHDPAHPTQYLPAYDSGDHLHPNDAGRQAIANAINLALLR